MRETLLQDLLTTSAERAPDAPAISIGGATSSYRELDDRSSRLARALRARGCAPGDRVALLARKGLEAYVGLWGALKAGCAYVPLDPRSPPDRLTYIVDDCAISALVTGPGMRDLASSVEADARRSWPRFALGEEIDGGEPHVVGPGEIGSHDPASPEVPSRADGLAYILYTSGSTGRPKGVMISHRNALAFVRWSSDHTGLDRGVRVSGHAPLHFDLSIYDVFATARAGGTLFPVPPGTSTFPARQAAWIIENEIEVWYSVPSALSMMALSPGFTELSFPSLRVVIFAGEVFPPKFLRKWVRQLPHATLMNWYGPTETNVVTAHTVVRPAEQIEEPLPIGRPCAGARIFLEDGERHPIESPGAVGEICVRGPSVALGYWGDPQKTERSFVDAPAGSRSGDRAYRTGDLGRFDESGTLWYQGRRDHQIKSRGYRIELGAIESALSDLVEVAEAAVVPIPDDVVGHRLLAVVALNVGASTEPHDILEKAAKVLPRYMVPEAVHFRTSLPKTSTGKVDRSALTKPLRNRAPAEGFGTDAREAP